jgi:ABC-2 type transport system permease protein
VTPTLGAVAWAFLRRELAIAASYRLTFAMRGLAILVSCVALAFTAQFVGASEGGAIERYGAAGYLGFWVVGVVVADVFYSTATALAASIRQAQLEGTLDAMLAAPAPTAYVVLCAPVGQVVVAVLRSALTLGVAALLFGLDFDAGGALAVAAVVALALVSFAMLGVIGGAVTMLLRRTDPITYGLSMFGAVIGGVLFPVDQLPDAVSTAAYMFPLAPALEALRLVLFAGAGLGDVRQELAVMAAFAALATVAGAWLFAHALRRARADGSLTHY